MNSRSLLVVRLMLLVAGGAIATPCAAQSCLWEQVASTGPTNLSPVAVWDSARQRVVVVDSREFGNGQLRTWEWDGVSWLLRAEGGPLNRSRFAIAYDNARSRLVLFGGFGSVSTPFLADTWEWNGSAWSLAAISGPPGRHSHSMTFDAARSRVLMCGGYNSSPVSDTWSWDGISWTQVAQSGPVPRMGAAMAYDAGRQQTVLFGGQLFNSPAFSDLWEWDGAAWTQRFTTTPAGPRAYASLVYDPVRARMVFFGGASFITGGPALSDTWEFDGLAGSWLLRTAGGPPAALARPFAFDPVHGVGVFLDQLGGTWQWSGAATSTPPWIGEHPISLLQANPGSTVTLSVEASGTSPLQYTWRRSGIALVNGGAISGVTTPTLTISPASIEHSGYYTVDVSNACGITTSRASQVQIGPPVCYINCDGGTTPPILNVNDFICFLNRFAAGDPYANCDLSTNAPALNVNDFICFNNRYAAGCS